MAELQVAVRHLQEKAVGRYPSLEAAEQKALALEVEWNEENPAAAECLQPFRTTFPDGVLAPPVIEDLSWKWLNRLRSWWNSDWPTPWIVEVWVEALKGCWSSVTEVFLIFGAKRGTR